MIALRTADGDLLGALVECEEMAKAGALGTWTPSDGDRMTLVRLKEHWHRAYLLRMVAQTLTGAEHQAFIGYAERARARTTPRWPHRSEPSATRSPCWTPTSRIATGLAPGCERRRCA
jgi:hypothetical protein